MNCDVLSILKYKLTPKFLKGLSIASVFVNSMAILDLEWVVRYSSNSFGNFVKSVYGGVLSSPDSKDKFSYRNLINLAMF
jgi:hypothetical protein